MSEYIEREELIRNLKDEIKECGDAHISDRPIAYGTILGLKSALSYAKALSTADVVEVVRCRECESYNGHRYCLYHADPVLDDDFCSYGKRKEGAEG